MTDTPKHIPSRIHILFDGPPGADAGRFVEVEDDAGHSINAGEWVDRGDGQWALVIDRAAVVADSPELAQALRERGELSATVAELEAERGTMVSEQAFREFSTTLTGQRDAARAELAQSRERIAALSGQVDSALKTIIAASETADMLLQQRAELVIERDAALARVRELEAANEDLRRWIAQHQEERAAVDRALKDATDAAGTTSMHGQGRDLQPKTRDESGPAPGWECTCAEDLRIAAGELRDVPVDDPSCAERCRIAVGYRLAAQFLDSRDAAPAADPEGGAPPEATP